MFSRLWVKYPIAKKAVLGSDRACSTVVVLGLEWVGDDWGVNSDWAAVLSFPAKLELPTLPSIYTSNVSILHQLLGGR